MTEKMIKELEEEVLKDIDLEKIIAEALKETLKEKADNDVNKGKAEIHIEKDGLNVTTKMNGNAIILVSLLGMALKEIQNKSDISDDEVKKIMEHSHTFGREDM